MKSLRIADNISTKQVPITSSVSEISTLLINIRNGIRFNSVSGTFAGDSIRPLPDSISGYLLTIMQYSTPVGVLELNP